MPMTSPPSMRASPNETLSANDIGIDLVLLQFGVERGAADLEGLGGALDVAACWRSALTRICFSGSPS